MRLDERDLALSFENHTRQIWAEKHLDMPPSADQAVWTKWYNYLHDQVETGFKVKWPGAVDMTPVSPEEPFTEAYQTRLKTALRRQRAVIGAHYAFQNVSVRAPVTLRRAGTENVLELYFLRLHPVDPNRAGRGVENFLYVKSHCAQTQLEADGFEFLPPRGLKPSLSTTLASTHLETLAGDSETFQSSIVSKTDFLRVVEKANASLGDPFTPPGEGLLFEPLDAVLLKREEFSRCLIANRSGLFGFEDVKIEAAKVQDAQYARISDRCLVRGTEAVRWANSPNAELLRSDRVLACSVAAIPLLRCEEDKVGVPLAAIFTWRKKGKIKRASFDLGDVLSRSARLRRFQNRLVSGEFNNSVAVCIDQRSQDFVNRFTGGAMGCEIL